MKNSETSSKAPTTQAVEWVPPIISNGTTSSDKITQKYFEDLGEDAIPFKNSEAATKRKEMASKQIPAHDFAPEKCDNLTEFEAEQLKKYVDNVKENYFGQGEVNLAKPLVPAKPPKSSTSANIDTVNNNLVGNMRNLTVNDPPLSCRGCTDSILSSYVIAKKLGPDAHWHPKCFKCARCSQLLVDLIYFHYNNEIYCARDLAELMDIPRCSGCDELILVSWINSHLHDISLTKEIFSSIGARVHACRWEKLSCETFLLLPLWSSACRSAVCKRWSAEQQSNLFALLRYALCERLQLLRHIYRANWARRFAERCSLSHVVLQLWLLSEGAHRWTILLAKSNSILFGGLR